MASPAKSEVLLTLYAECTEVCGVSPLTSQPKSLSWTRSIVELTRRYILLLSEDRSRILFKCSIPDILTVARYTMARDHPYTVRLQVGESKRRLSGIVFYQAAADQRERREQHPGVPDVLGGCHEDIHPGPPAHARDDFQQQQRGRTSVSIA